ncbi:MAG: ribonuclease HI [Flavobacterium sp.]|nr:ribonuclease HI [Flavobacterium sp.]
MQTEKIFPEVNIYTDGGAEPNPGKGGFGVIMTYKKHKKEFSQGYLLTTNNRMELMGVIFGLEKIIKPSIVNIYSDSKYVVDAISKGWAEKWKSKNWFRSGTSKVINHDLWEKLLDLISKQYKVTFNWIKGHDGHIENERCDQLADIALNGNNLLEDTGYLTTDGNSISSENSNQANQTKTKVSNEGDNCRKCNTPVVKKLTKKKSLKPNQEYYFEYFFLCPNCKTMYMVEEAKRFRNDENKRLFT